MTRRTITLMQELPLFLHGCSVEECYQLARALRHELVRRGLSAGLVADELAEILLAEALIEHRAIFSGDCSESKCRPPFHVATCAIAHTDAVQRAEQS